MKLLIIGTIDADYENREEVLCERILVEMEQGGHDVNLIYLPFKRDMLNAAEQIFAYSLVDTAGADAIITVGYPACFVPHSNERKVSYLFDCYPEIHEKFIFQLREHRVEERQRVIEAITLAERKAFAATKRVFTGSEELYLSMNERYGVVAGFLPSDDVDLSKKIECVLL